MKNPSLLFAGTERGVYAIGRRRRRAGDPLTNDFPIVAVHDLVIHPRDGDLIAATHGRSLWILDDITPLQQLTPAVLDVGCAPVQQQGRDDLEGDQPRRHARPPDVPGP